MLQIRQQKHREMAGPPVQEIVGRPVREILGEEPYVQFRSHIEGALAGKVQEFEATVTYPGSLERKMEITYVPQVGLDISL